MEAPPLERKLAAIFAADVAGYSRLMEEDEEATLSEHRRLVDATIARFRGRVAGTAGDSLLAEFASVTDAVRAALAIQESLATANDALTENRRMRFRIGINVGDVMVKDDDIFGDGVNIASRLEALAEPGGICVSRGVRDHIRNKVKTGFEDLGEQSVKNISRPIRVFRLRPSAPGESAGNGSANGTEPEPVPASADDVEIAFWDAIKHSALPLEYRTYLERYPEGAFAALARVRCEGLEDGGSAPLRGSGGPNAVHPMTIELAFWESVSDSGNADMYRAYLAKYPAGEFTTLATAKLAEIDAEP